MSQKLQRHVSKIFNRSASAHRKEEGTGSGHESVAPPKSPRSRPAFSLSSLSFRRPSATPSILTPPHTPPPATEANNLNSSSSSSGEEEEESDDILHIRNPPPSIYEHEQSSMNASAKPATSYFDFSPSHFTHLHQERTLERFHAHTAPPSPLSASYHPPSSHVRSNLLEPPTLFSSSTVSSSQVSELDPNEPKSAFSDWGTSVGGVTDSRNISSEDLSEENVEGEEESFTAVSNGVVDMGTGKVQSGAGARRGETRIDRKEEEETSASTSDSPTTSNSSNPPSSNSFDPNRRRSVPTVSAPLPPTQHRPHLVSHHTHQHSMHSRMIPRESKVADSSYPELAIAFFMSLKKFKGRKLDRRASTGSLGGAV